MAVCIETDVKTAIIEECVAGVIRSEERKRLDLQPRNAFLHRETGERYRAMGIPLSVRRSDLDIVPDGFALTNGSTDYKRFATLELGRQWQAERLAKIVADFRVELESMDAEELQTQLAFWQSR